MSKKEKKTIEWLSQNHKNFCVLPWVNLNTNPDGKLKLCCNIQNNNSVLSYSDQGTLTPFNLGYHDIDEIWNSEYMAKVRGEQLSNQGSSACNECYKIETLTGSSPRVGQNQDWLKKRLYVDGVSRTIDPAVEKELTELSYMPISLELRLGNQCNLQCSSCWGMSSSLTHDERSKYIDDNLLETKELQWLKQDWEINRKLVNDTDLKDWFETDTFYENFKKMAPNLKRLYTTGGEPTLIKANYKMFQMLIDAGNTDCRVEFTSNMTTWNPEFYDRLAQFKNVEIQISVDGIDEVGEYIRYPSDFNKVRENIYKAAELAADRPDWILKCYTVLQALNFRDVKNIWEFLDQVSNKFHKPIIWWPITLTSPTHLSLAAVTAEQRINHIENIKIFWNKTYLKHKLFKENEMLAFNIDQNTWNAYYNTIMNSPYDKTQHTRLIEYVKFIDKQRLQDGELIFGDLL